MKFMLDTAAILADYRALRPVQRRIGTLASKKIGKPAIESGAKVLGLWQHGRLVLEAEEEINVLLDHLIHDGHGGPTTPLERITLHQLTAVGGEGSRIHAALCTARVNAFRLAERLPGLGWRVEDIWHHRSRVVVDELLSEQTQLTDAVAVMRLVDLGDWCFSTGLQGPTLGDRNLETLEALLLASPLAGIAPTNFHPESFTRSQNLLWSRCLLRAWLRPGSVKLVTFPIEIGPGGRKAKLWKGR
ncbi:MAG: hypothetical protein HYZ13_09330 [Acidobacteria bacterium]|nr:hypothetical protein [Acidobacteriota bacterium]